jgi:predicted  nucleic acid-binding Zn-ribbon protein
MKPTPLGKTYLEYETELKEYNLAKTELAMQKVELGLVDDFNKLLKEAEGFKNKYKGDSESLINSVKKAKITMQNYRDTLFDAKALLSDISKKTSELGLELPKEIISAIETISKGAKATSDANKILMKIQQDIPLL